MSNHFACCMAHPQVYAESARSAVHSVLQGYNASIIAYGQVKWYWVHDWYISRHGLACFICSSAASFYFGVPCACIHACQTGTGKTYTMEGEHSGPHRGIIPRAIEDVFAYIQVSMLNSHGSHLSSE